MKIRIAILLSSLISACSWGPPNLSGVLRDPPAPDEVALISIFHVEAERAMDYKDDHPGRGDSLMEYRNLNLLIGKSFATRHLFVAPYMNWIFFNPGLAIGAKSDRAYLAVNGAVHLLPHAKPGLDGEWGLQAGYRPVDWFTLVVDEYRSEAFDWENDDELSPYALMDNYAASKRRQNVLRVSPVLQFPGSSVTMFTSALYGLEGGNWGLGLSFLFSAPIKIKRSKLSGPPMPVSHPPYY